MNLQDFAKHECANHLPDGSCQGLDISDSGALVPLWPQKHNTCNLALGEPCRYFEFCILPARRWLTDKLRLKQYEDAAATYRNLQARSTLCLSSSRKCPVCNTNPLPPRTRMCSQCRAEKRRQTLRAYMRNYRSHSHDCAIALNGRHACSCRPNASPPA